MGCSSKPLDIDALAFMIGNPACFRRLVLALRSKHYNNRIDGGDASSSEKAKYDYDESINFVTMKENRGHNYTEFYRSVESAEQRVVSMITEYNEAVKNNKPLKITG